MSVAPVVRVASSMIGTVGVIAERKVDHKFRALADLRGDGDCGVVVLDDLGASHQTVTMTVFLGRHMGFEEAVFEVGGSLRNALILFGRGSWSHQRVRR